MDITLNGIQVSIEVPVGKKAVVDGCNIKIVDDINRRYTIEDFRTLKIAADFTDDDKGRKNAQSFLKACEAAGIKWSSGKKPTERTLADETIAFGYRGAFLTEDTRIAHIQGGYIIVPFAQFDLPVKTYAQDFFEKFPNVSKNSYGVPVSCWACIYPKERLCPKIDSPTDNGCAACWNRPMEEENAKH